MRRFMLALAWCGLLSSGARADERIDALAEEHKKWLTEDVVYIITELEQDVFLTLESVDERNRFIEAFWKKRDPNRATPENEFRVEHYRRLDYANEYFSRDTFRDGWRTDRGRYYIILGEPMEIDRFDGYTELVSSHLWFYAGEPGRGTPSFFFLLFYKRNDIGEYRLYRPSTDGPMKLLRPNSTARDPLTAIGVLVEISPDLAHASLSYDTSEPPNLRTGTPSVRAEDVIVRVEESPFRAVRTEYADAWLRYGNRVSADYSFNFVPSRNVFSILVDRSGTAIVQYSIEIDPQNFSLETDDAQSKYYTTLDLTFEARSPDGTLVVANTREAFLELTPSQALEVRSQPFAYQDDFPLVPGDYTVSVVVRNRVDTHYTVAEAEVSIPDLAETGPVLSDVILAYDAKTIAEGGAEGDVYTYQVGRLRLSPSAGGVFVIGDTVHLATQAFGAGVDHEVVFDLVLDEETVRSVTSPVGAFGLTTARLPLDELSGGVYDVRARLLSPLGEVSSERVVPLNLSPRSVADRPRFVYRRGIRTDVPGLLSFIRGEQLWNLGRFDEAKTSLEAAVASGNERLVPARWMLANAYLREERADDALRLLLPLEAAFGQHYDVVAGFGLVAHLKGEHAIAIGYLERAAGLRAPDTRLLNALGDSHRHLGNTDASREAYERSLALDPDQPAIEEHLRD